MMTTTKTTCDYCQRDLTYTGNCVDYRIKLCSEDIPSDPESNSCTAMHVEPAYKRAHHFCHVRCLTEFLTQQNKSHE